MEMPSLFLRLDPFLIWFFRLTGHGVIDFLLGTTMMAVLAFLLGKISASLVVRAGRRYARGFTDEAKKYHDLSIEALQAGERPVYEAANRLANEAFSRSFFLGVAQSGGFFWPIVILLAWMQYRFHGLAFPLPVLGWSISFMGVFILLYILVWLSWSAGRKSVRKYWPPPKEAEAITTTELPT